MNDNVSYITVIGEVLEAMYNDGIMDKIDIDSKEGRYKLLERNIDKIRSVAEVCKQSPAYLSRTENIVTFIADNITPCVDQEEKIHKIWTHFLVKIAASHPGISNAAVTCFCIPIFIDCWDNNI